MENVIDMRRDRKRENLLIGNTLVMIFQFSINMLVPIFMCTFLGVWIGEKININWIVIPLFFMGAMAGFTNIYKMARKMMEVDEKTQLIMDLKAKKDKQHVKKTK